MHVAIRVDSASFIGAGHVSRSLTLADGLRAGGSSVSFVCREHEPGVTQRIASRGYTVATLPAGGHFRPECAPPHAAWIGASWEADAHETRNALAAMRPNFDWLVVDHYGLDARWERALRPSTAGILAIDDLADRPHDCDVLLDQNLVENMRERYAGKLPAECTALLGPRHALLQPLYEELRARLAPSDRPIRRILISFGGADPSSLAGFALQAFLNLGRSDIEVDVVVGSAADATQIGAALDGRDNVHVHSAGLPSLAPLMARADLAIGAAGSTSWERACLGLFALVVTMADNQKAIAEALHNRGMIAWLGHWDEVDVARMERALRACISRGAQASASRLCRETVDGRGLQRVIAAMELKARDGLVVRAAGPADEALLREWANDAVTRSSSFSSARIGADEHHRWFEARLGDGERCRMFILENARGVPVGQVRFEREQDAWNINYSVAAPYRGMGLGRRILELALRELRAHAAVDALVGRVAQGNLPSQMVFVNLGFAPAHRADGTLEYRLNL